VRLNHLDLHVPNVLDTSAFFREHFDLREVACRGDSLAILNDEAGFELVISRANSKLGATDQANLGLVTYHVGFVLPAREMVDALHDRLVARGLPEIGEPRAIRGGWLFYCRAPGNVLVEVGWRP
jgi:catechol 2,3-dioxygenase-like lactoylglutathione lyase family enzyme